MSVWRLVSAGVVASVALVVGCSAPPAAAPTVAPPAPTLAPAASTAAPAAPSAAVSNTVSGAVSTINGRSLTISTNTGDKQVQLADGALIEQEGKGALADLKPGLAVGITGRPDGSNVTAVSIRIFPAALGTPRPGQFPMTGANAGNLMTNSVIESFDGSNLVVNAAGQRFQISVPAATEVLKPVPASLTDLTSGTRVLAMGSAAPDGSLQASSINLFGPPAQ